MDLNEIVVFAGVVRAGSFTKAAHELGMPKSTVSRKVSELEQRLGAKLLERTTRKLELTEVGRAYFQHCKRILIELEEAELAVSRMQSGPRTRLRIIAPMRLPFLGPLFAEAIRGHPDLHLEVVCSDREPELIEAELIDQGFDLAIGLRVPSDARLMVRELGGLPRILVASPTYLEDRPTPSHPEDLRVHACLLFDEGEAAARWRLSGESDVELELSGPLTTNDLTVLHASVLAGHGIAMLPRVVCEDDLQAGRLHVVLPGWAVSPVSLLAILPRREPGPDAQQGPPELARLVDSLVQLFGS